MRIFYINRDVDSDRREMMKAALQETGIEAERLFEDHRGKPAMGCRT